MSNGKPPPGHFPCGCGDFTLQPLQPSATSRDTAKLPACSVTMRCLHRDLLTSLRSLIGIHRARLQKTTVRATASQKFSNIANSWPQIPSLELMLNILFEAWFPNQPFDIESHRTSRTPVPEIPRFLQSRTWRRNTHREASAESPTSTSSNSSLGSRLLKP